MQLTVRLFAGLRQQLGTTEITLEVPSHCTAETLKACAKRSFPEASTAIDAALVARNRTYAAPDAQLEAADEIALIPPVSGGSTDYPACMITEEALSLDAARATLLSPNLGGITLFAGTVREWTGTRHTVELSYEAYAEMALSVMHKIQQDVAAEHPDVRMIQWHRIGRLIPTDTAVICGAAAAHRAESFEVARTLIERLKNEVPIWKQEVDADGNAQWQANT